MKTTFGQFNPDGGEGFLRPVFFPSLATMGVRTGDGRLLAQDGGGIYGGTLPRPIMAQFKTLPGHMEAEAVGSLQEVTFHEDGNISGKGWLADVPEAHRLVTLMQSQSLFHNSVDLADVEYTAEWESDDPDDPGFWNLLVDFTKYALAATTFVPTPAFSNAHGSLDAPTEITASAMVKSGEPIEVVFESFGFVVPMDQPEITADGAPTVPWDDFHRPEAPTLKKVAPDEHGVVTGHLAAWGQCHDGVDNRCVLAPRPADYRAFCEPGVMTDRGMVETGPIFFLGGHPRQPLGKGDRWAAYGGVENAWADVVVTNGRLGPWVSGRVRPGISAEDLYAARASRVSGHWRADNTLAAIVSVNVPGYNIPGSGLSADRDGGRIEGGRVVELVASLHAPPAPERPDPQKMLDMLGGIQRWSSMTPITSSSTTQVTYTTAADEATKAEVEIAEALSDAVDKAMNDPKTTEALERLALLLELELELDD
jgi:hypothetical protein